MSKYLHSHWLISLIILFAACIRLYQLGSFPISLSPDEVALGYNAYSILKTGRDEHGAFLPLVFKSYGDYKPGLYIYLTVPFVAILGLTELTVRLPGAILGIVAVWLTYLILKYALPDIKFKVKGVTVHAGHLAALTLAANPWHMSFTRGAWESGIAITEMLLAVYFMLIALRTKSTKYLSLAMAIAGLTLWTYHGAKLSTFLMLTAGAAIYCKQLLKSFTYKQLLIAGLTFIIIASPILLGIMSGQGGRFAVFSVFSYPRTQEQITQTILEPTGLQQGDIPYKLFYSEPLNFATSILRRYFAHFSPQFLFFKGDTEHPQYTIPYTGVLYWWDAISIIFGIIYLIKRPSKFGYFILVWLILAPIPSALSRDELNAVRSLPTVIPLTMLIGFGLFNILKSIKSSYRIYGTALILGCYLFSFIYMVDQYYIVAPFKNAKHQYYGYKEVVLSTQEARGAGAQLHMSQSYDQPYMYFLFYDRYDPHTYQQTNNYISNSQGDVGLISQINPNITFGAINWSADQNQIGHIFVGDPVTTIHPEKSSDPNKYNVIEVNYPDGHGRFRIVEVLN